MSSERISQGLYSRYMSLRACTSPQTFKNSMINCISKKLPGNQQSVDLIFEYLSTLYTEYQNAEKKQRYSQDRSEMITKIAQIITEGVSSVGPELEGAVAGAPSFVEEASFHLIGIIRQRLLQDHSTPSASVFTTLTRNEQSLWDVLELMRFGRFTVAARKIASCWAPDDSLIIATSGLDVYHEQLRGGNYGEDAMNVQFATLTQSKIQDRTVDVKNASAETIQQWATTIHPPPTKENVVATESPKAEWTCAYYDQEFVNSWFFAINENYITTEKLEIQDIQKSDQDHAAYIVCYSNSCSVRLFMSKSYIEDFVDEQGRKTASSTRHMKALTSTSSASPDVEKPCWFIQTTNGSCCTMALVNFLINQDPTTHGTIIKKLLLTVQDKLKANENYKDLVEKSNDLYSMHHMMLTPSITNDTMEVDDLVKEDTPALSENELEDENHLILIFPYYGNVWEVDSLDETGPLNLGPCGDNWVDSALPRLVQWKNTVQKTSTPVDIQAILKV